MNHDQSFTDLQSKIPYDASRDAINSIRGYDWQRWLTILNWVGLKGEECLWIEWGEDFSVAGGPEGIRTIQAKSSAKPISLGFKSILSIVETAISRPSGVSTVIWTRGGAASENNSPFADGAIAEWQRVQLGQADGKALRDFLLGVPAASKSLKKILQAAKTAEQIHGLLGKVRWVMGEQDISGVKARVILAIESRLAELNVVAPSLKREVFCNLLFEFVGQISIQRDPASRKLSRVSLDEWIGAQIAALIGAVAVERYNRALQLLDNCSDVTGDSAVSRPAPFTLPWYVYSERTAALIGRAGELSHMRQFLDDEGMFLIQLLGGEAGTGKSRLALEFMRGLDGRWLKGFLRADDLSDLLAELPMAGGHVFVAVDYAGSSPQELRRFIDRAEREAVRHRVKIRLLLIERDVTENAEWRRSISEELNRGGAAFARAHRSEPIILCSVHGLDLNILRAWIEAAGFDTGVLDALGDETQEKIAQICQGNPLLLGFAAAAIVSEESKFFDVPHLLDGLLRREFSKIRVENNAALLDDDVIGIAAVATSSRFDLSRPHDEDVFLAKTKQGSHVYVVETAEDMKRFLTVGEIRSSHRYSVLQQIIARHGEDVTAAIASTFSSGSPSTLLRISQRIFGRSCVVQPDLVGEYLLALHWSKSNAFNSKILAGTDDDQLQKQVALAYMLSPHGLLVTLSFLREKTWAATAYVRVMPVYVDLMVEDAHTELPDWHREELLRLLYNSTISVGSKKPTSEVIRVFVEKLRRLMEHWPENRSVRYRLLKAEMMLMKSTGTRSSPDVLLAWLTAAKGFHSYCEEHANDKFYMHLADALREATQIHLMNRSDPRKAVESVKALVSLCRSIDDPELIRVTFLTLFDVSVAISDPHNEETFSDGQARFARSMLVELSDTIVEFFKKFHSRLTIEQAIEALKVLGNCNFAYAKLGNLSACRRIYQVISTDWPTLQNQPDKLYIELVSLWNWTRFGPDRLQSSTMLRQCKGAVERCRPFLGNVDDLSSAVLQLIITSIEKSTKTSSNDLVAVLLASLSFPINERDTRGIRTFTKLALDTRTQVRLLRERDEQIWLRLYDGVYNQPEHHVSRRIAAAIWFPFEPGRADQESLDVLRTRLQVFSITGSPMDFREPITDLIAEYYLAAKVAPPGDILPGAILRVRDTSDAPNGVIAFDVDIDVDGEVDTSHFDFYTIPIGPSIGPLDTMGSLTRGAKINFLGLDD